MSREEYLNQLHKYLRKLPRQDYEDAMEYFTEYFQETDEEEGRGSRTDEGTWYTEGGSQRIDGKSAG